MEPQTQSEYQPDYEEQQYDELVDQAFDVSNAAAADAIPQQATSQSEPPPVNRRATPEGSRNGLIRALLIGIGAIIVIIIVLVGGFSLYKSSHNQPLTVEAYPNATVINKAATANSDSVTYTSLDSVDLVADFYSRLLGSSANRAVNEYISMRKRPMRRDARFIGALSIRRCSKCSRSPP